MLLFLSFFAVNVQNMPQDSYSEMLTVK